MTTADNALFAARILTEYAATNGYEATKKLLGFESICSITQYAYKFALDEIIPIEQIDKAKKEQLWNESGEHYTDKAKRIEWCKAVHFLENLLQIKNNKNGQ